MAEPQEPARLVEPVATPQHYMEPTTREVRTQSVHRLQVGLFGLGAMVLLVGLANIIMDRASENEEVDPAMEEVIAVDEQPKKQSSDPLADIGVVPETDPQPETGSELEAELIAPQQK
jgi:hypothetical protein